MSKPWFAGPWKRGSSGAGGTVAAFCYLGAGVANGLLAIVSNGMVPRLLALSASAVFLALGFTLLATLRWRRRTAPDLGGHARR
ncbi:MAG: hypothetical protein GY745_01185 [Actinomycetia bacterium]|nr:hypothetical protein [Actinomycetes bacterium]